MLYRNHLFGLIMWNDVVIRNILISHYTMENIINCIGFFLWLNIDYHDYHEIYRKHGGCEKEMRLHSFNTQHDLYIGKCAASLVIQSTFSTIYHVYHSLQNCKHLFWVNTKPVKTDVKIL